MKRHARVISTGDYASALVELDSISQCHRCRRGQGCGAGVFSAGPTAGLIQIQCSTQQPLETGQQVLVEIDEHGSQWLWLVFGAYGLPLLGMLLACAVTSFCIQHLVPLAGLAESSAMAEFCVALASAAGLAGGFFAWRLLEPRALSSAQRGTCLQSARIVATNPVS